MAKIALSGPADLLATIPYHLGFYPSSSVVVVCFHRNRLGLMARLDAATGPHVGLAVESLLPVLRREAPTSVTLASFEVTPGETLSLHQALADGIGAAGTAVRERLLVRDGRWSSLDRTGRCYPPQGLPMPLDADVPAVAAFVGLGQAVLTDRASRARLVAPVTSDDPRHDGLVRGIERWQQRYSWSVVADPGAGGSTTQIACVPPLAGIPAESDEPDERRRHHLVDEALACWRVLLSPQLDDDLLAVMVPQLVAPLRFTELRDAIIAWLCPGAMPLVEVDPALVEQLEAQLGPELRGAAVGGDYRPTASAAPPRAVRGPRPPVPWPPSAGVSSDDVVNGPMPFGGDWDAAVASRLVQSRLVRLCREAPTDHAAPVLSLLACYAWWSGDGTLAGMAVDQALEIEADHRLSGLVRSALDHGLRAMGTAA